MTTIELKDILIHKIAAINTIIDTKLEKLIYKTTPEQRQRIKEGQEQLAKGEYLSNDKVEASIDTWLNEK